MATATTAVQQGRAQPDRVVLRQQALPSTLPISLLNYPKMNALQAGHLRHFHNLATQKDGAWHHMGSADPGQEMFEAYRYQIANMSYATSLAYYHRLPALRGVFKPLMHQLIHKMLLRDVWQYWFNCSLGGKLLDPGLQKLREPWADPVVRENIMYSGHLLLMTSLYGMLFDDDEYDRPGSIVFNWDPVFWGMGTEKFSYSNPDLQAIITSEMEKNDWIGVCCEPNVVFIICNQFPLIAIRYNDVRHKTAKLDDILVKYVAAWEKKAGMLASDGQFNYFWMVRQDVIVPPRSISSSAWAATFMNSWNPGFVRANFEHQRAGFVTSIDGKTRLQTSAVGNAMRQLVSEHPDQHRHDSAQTLATAIAVAGTSAMSAQEREKQPAFGYVVQWLSELGEEELLSGLLEYADERLRPTWENGGLFYPRHDELRTENWDWTYMDPYTGNSAIGYGRLNVPGGQNKMFEKPWTSDELGQRPHVDNVDLAQGVDFLRGIWDPDQAALIVTVKTWDGQSRRIEPAIKNLSAGNWGIYTRGQLQRVEAVADGGSLSVSLDIGAGEELDLVLHRG